MMNTKKLTKTRDRIIFSLATDSVIGIILFNMIVHGLEMSEKIQEGRQY